MSVQVRIPRRAFWLCIGAAVFVLLAHSSGEAVGNTRSQRKAVLFLETNSALGTETNFGTGATSSVSARTLREPFEAVGMRFVSTASLILPGEDPPQGLPLTDSAAVAMAGTAGADVCVIAGITVVPKGRIRATRQVAYEAQLHVRVLDVQSGSALVSQSARDFAYAKHPGQGTVAAMAGSISKLGREFAGKVHARWPPQTQTTGSMSTVQITGAQGWRQVAAILKQLAASKGIQFVHLLEIGEEQVKLRVSTTMSPGSLVALLQRTRIYNGSISVVRSGSTITMNLRVLPTPAPSLNG